MKKPLYESVALIAVAMLAMYVHPAQANPAREVGNMKSAGKARGADKLPVADGEVEDIDIANKYVIIKHGPIANLNMEPMAMAFAVRDAAMLTKAKAGDKVKFTAKNIGDVPTIMSLRVQR